VLRLTRLLLVASAAAALGAIVFIASRAAFLSPYLLLFALAAALFVAAARAIGHDRRRGRILAWAGALALAGIGTLAGFGAGEVTFPAAALGVLAAWTALLTPPTRASVVAFLAYLGLTFAFALARAPSLFAFPPLIPSVFLFPLTLSLAFGSGPAVFAVFGAAIALAAWGVAPAEHRPARWPLALALGVGLGLALDGLTVVRAIASPSTSARFELGWAPLLIVFTAGLLLAAGLVLSRSRTRGAAILTTVGSAVVLYALLSRPTVECRSNGVDTASGPWWLPALGPASGSSSGSISSGAGVPGGSAGVIQRGDGVRITYSCAGDQLVEFEIRR
jgi:hypothetical protein